MTKKLITNRFVRDYLLGIIETIESLDSDDAAVVVGALRTVLGAVKGVDCD